MAKPSLLCLFSYDLSTCLKNRKILNCQKYFLIIRELKNLLKSSPDFYSSKSDKVGLSFLIGCLCDGLDCDVSFDELLLIVSFLKDLIEHVSDDFEFISSILPGTICALFKVVCSKCDPLLISQDPLQETLKCVFLLISIVIRCYQSNYISLNLHDSVSKLDLSQIKSSTNTVQDLKESTCRTEIFDHKAIVNLESILNSLLLKLHCKSFPSRFFDFLSSLLVDLITSVQSDKFYKWFDFLFGFLFKILPKVSFTNQQQLVRDGIQKSQYAISYLENIQDEKKESDTFLFFSCLICKNYDSVNNLFVESPSLFMTSILERKTFLPVLQNYFMKPIQQLTSLEDIFSCSKEYSIFVNAIEFSSVSLFFYQKLSLNENSLKTLLMLSKYMEQVSTDEIVPFIDLLFEQSFLFSSERDIRLASHFLLKSFIQAHQNSISIVPSVIFSLLETVFNDDIFISHLSMESIVILSRKCNFSSAVDLLTHFKSIVFGKLTLSLHYKPDSLIQSCKILANIMKMFDINCFGLVDDCIAHLTETIREIDLSSESSIAAILCVFDEYFRIYSTNIDGSSEFTRQTCIDLLRTIKYLLSKDFVSVQYFTLRVFDHALPILATFGKDFLPLVNEYWTFLMERIKTCLSSNVNQQKMAIAESSLSIIGKFCLYCEDFVRDRICKELFPLLDSLSRKVRIEKVIDVVYCFCCKLKKLRSQNINVLLLLILPQCNKNTSAEKCLNALIENYPVFCWFYLNQYSVDNHSYQNANPSLQRIDFSSFKRTNLSYSIDGYLKKL